MSARSFGCIKLWQKGFEITDFLDIVPDPGAAPRFVKEILAYERVDKSPDVARRAYRQSSALNHQPGIFGVTPLMT